MIVITRLASTSEVDRKRVSKTDEDRRNFYYEHGDWTKTAHVFVAASGEPIPLGVMQSGDWLGCVRQV